MYIYFNAYFIITFEEGREAKGWDEAAAGKLTHKGVYDQNGNQIYNHIDKVRQHATNCERINQYKTLIPG